MSKRYYERRQKALQLLGNACAACGAEEDLHIDHVDPLNKTMNLAKRLHGAPWVEIEKELSKCQLLCKSCHEAKTSVDGSRLKNSAKGEKINHAKLTKQKVLEIRQKYENKEWTQAKLAKEYGVSRSAIHQILNRVTWKHV